MSLTVTVVDNETGDTDSAQVADGDYILITCDPCHRLGVTIEGDGAVHVVRVGGRLQARGGDS